MNHKIKKRNAPESVLFLRFVPCLLQIFLWNLFNTYNSINYSYSLVILFDAVILIIKTITVTKIRISGSCSFFIEQRHLFKA